MGRLLLIALRNLRAHRRRSLLLGGAIALVTAMFLVLLAVAGGAERTLVDSATALVSGHVQVSGFYKVTPSRSSRMVSAARQVAADLQEGGVPGLRRVVSRPQGFGKLVSDAASLDVGLTGIDLSLDEGFGQAVRIRHGRLQDLARDGGLLLFEAQARKLKVAVGDAVTVVAPTLRGASNSVDLTVAAIAADAGLLSRFNAFASDQAVRRLLQLSDDATGGLHLYLADLEQADAVAELVRRRLREKGHEVLEADGTPFWDKQDAIEGERWVGQRLDVTVWRDEIAFFGWTVTALRALSGLLTAVLLLVVAVGVMNALWVAIRERTPEIGTLRAIGMQRGRVAAMFVSEGLLLGALASAAGALLGLAACAGLNALRLPVPLGARLLLMSDTLRLEVAPGTLVLPVLVVTASTTAIALFPSYLASRLRPVVAMQKSG